MKPNRIALVKIPNLGESCLIMGVCRQLDGEDYWEEHQLFTMLEVPDKTSTSAKFQNMAQGFSKYHKSEVIFDALDQPIEVSNQPHSFDFDNTKQYEITTDQRVALYEEMSDDGWSEFDWETWGK